MAHAPTRKTGPLGLPLLRWLAGLVCVVLVACQVPPGAGSPGASSDAARATSDAITFIGRQPDLGQPAPAVDTAIRGRVEFPQEFKVQASSNYVAAGAALALYDDTGATVVVGKTDSNGNFTLLLNGYNPSGAGETTYLLEASRNLAKNAAGKDALRFRTILRWTGLWDSISGPGIVVNALTTALALESSLDPANVKAINTIAKVSYPNPLTGEPFKAGGHPDAEINGLAAAILGFLAGDVDPVSSVTAIKPRVDAITPTAEVGQAVRIDGVGFSPLLSGNVVTFESGVQAGVYLATPTSLLVSVPQGAVSGNVSVATSLGSSAGVPFTVRASQAGTGIAISNLVPPSARSGDTINIVGQGFSNVAAANVITFGNNKVATPVTASFNALTVRVPSGASSGNLSLKVGTTTSNGFFFNIDRPVITAAEPDPFEGTPGTQVTITGTNFGRQGANSTVRFNGKDGTDAKSVSLWQDGKAVALSPDPNPAKVVSGPVVIINEVGDYSEDFSSFVARSSMSDTFTTSTYYDSALSDGVNWAANAIGVGGLDGDLTVPAGQTRTLGTGDAPRSLLNASAPAGANRLTLVSASGFAVGQEVFIVALWGTNAGRYDYRTITAIGGNDLTLDTPVSVAYTTRQALVQKVPHYGTVTVSGRLTGLGVDTASSTGGWLVFRAKQVTVNSGGSIDMTGLGATGGSRSSGGNPNGGAPRASASDGGGAGGALVSCTQDWGGGGGGYGEGGSASSPAGGSTRGGQGGQAVNGSNGGGGASSESCGSNVPGGGGGGGYGSAGEDGTRGLTQSSGWQMYGTGGRAGGQADLSRIFPGAGGGGGGAFSTGDGGTGGNGGGVVIVHALTLTNNGIISANGNNGGTDGYRNTGGGSGGSIYLHASTMSLAGGSVRVNGGAGQYLNCFRGNCSISNGQSKGGDGGFGRVRLQYATLNGSNFPSSGNEAASLPGSTPRSSGAASAPLAPYVGTAVSKGYDSRSVQPTFTSATLARTNNSGNVTGIEFSSSTDGSSWSSWTTNLASVPKRRYLRWRATVSVDATINSFGFNYTY
ncbi:MAG: IPT/TIG domain-containing protein [Candidatus Sericytochromatia bacterium]|nr:IPT/TIG domain-containing protein [Candidatus Tanganyikabacteria bacterium]